MEKINVIYIAGSGHCGSTLLDLIIGSCKDVFSTGEVGFYNMYRGKTNNNKNFKYLCTCKKEFNDCEFWNDIHKKGNFRLKKEFSIYENIVVGLKSVFPFLNRNKKKWTDDSYELFTAILGKLREEGQEVSYILDSSKEPRRLFYLLNDERLNVIPLLLIRDDRAVGNAYNRKSRIALGLKRRGFFTTVVVRWMLVNLVNFQLKKRVKKSFVFKYENFCINPEKHIQLLNKELSISIAPKSFLEELNQKTYHNIDGNGFRFKEIGAIKTNEKWKHELATPKKIIGRLITSPFRYFWRKEYVKA